MTVQNKVDPEVARATLAHLGAATRSATAAGTGLELHRYNGGPWTPLERYPFEGRVVAARS